MFNVGFYITEPTHCTITNVERNWKLEYAEAEWQWYLTGDPKVSTLGDIYGKVPEIWKRMADVNGKVNSNYGYQWERNQQINYVIGLLRTQPDTRQACISIYDCKEWESYKHDTPCTYAIQFTIVHNRLDMCVTMRSNDLWYGFCNDQYCFQNYKNTLLNSLICQSVYIIISHTTCTYTIIKYDILFIPHTRQKSRCNN